MYLRAFGCDNLNRIREAALPSVPLFLIEAPTHEFTQIVSAFNARTVPHWLTVRTDLLIYRDAERKADNVVKAAAKSLS